MASMVDQIFGRHTRGTIVKTARMAKIEKKKTKKERRRDEVYLPVGARLMTGLGEGAGGAMEKRRRRSLACPSNE